jgi:hypothetical protein
MNEQLLLAFVNAVDRTDVDARFVLHANAGFSNHVGHASLDPSSVVRQVAGLR